MQREAQEVYMSDFSPCHNPDAAIALIVTLTLTLALTLPLPGTLTRNPHNYINGLNPDIYLELLVSPKLDLTLTLTLTLKPQSQARRLAQLEEEAELYRWA